MKQVLFDRGMVRVENVPAPKLGRGCVLVEVAASLISVGTELSGVKRSGQSVLRKAVEDPEKVQKALKLMASKGLQATTQAVKSQGPSLLQTGYSCAGTVLDVANDVIGISKGDRVACAGAGYANHAEVVNVPKNLVVKVPESVAFEEACSATVGAIAMQGVRRADNRVGETVAVLGLGLIGQLSIQLLKAAGCRVCAIDIDPARVELAVSLGADLGLVEGRENLIRSTLEFTDGFGVDSTLITAASRSNALIQRAIEVTRKKGKVVIVGDVGLGMKRSPLYEKEIDVLISCSYGPGRYDPLYEVNGQDYPFGYVRWTENRNMSAVLDLMAARKLSLAPLVGASYPIEEADSAYQLFLSKDSKPPLAVLLSYPRTTLAEKLNTRHNFRFSSSVRGKIKVGLVGVGPYTQTIHLPNLKKLSDKFDVHALCTRSGHTLRQLGERYKASYVSTDYRELISDPSIDLLFVCTRHDTHVPISIEALSAGKAVFCEKPMALTEAELERLVSAISKSERPYVVGFNRRYSPAICIVKEELRKLGSNAGPKLISYRVNAESNPASWVFGEEGGGRVIGEACHMIDVFSFLTAAEVTDVKIQPLRDAQYRKSCEDNFVSILTYSNGDTCNLIYSSVGSPGLPKEYIEVHCGGLSLLIEDFNAVKLFGQGKTIWKSRTANKGHYEQLEVLAKTLLNESALPIPIEELVRTTRTSFKLAEALK